MFLSECVFVCELSRWSLIPTTGKSQSHNALGAAPNEEAAAAAATMRNQSQFEYWKRCFASLSFLRRFLQELPLLCNPWTWSGSIGWVHFQLVHKTHACITGTVKTINTHHKGKLGQTEGKAGPPSFTFCFWGDKNVNVWKTWLQKISTAQKMSFAFRYKELEGIIQIYVYLYTKLLPFFIVFLNTPFRPRLLLDC